MYIYIYIDSNLWRVSQIDKGLSLSLYIYIYIYTNLWRVSQIDKGLSIYIYIYTYKPVESKSDR